MRIEIGRGEVTDQHDIDAIVDAANTDLAPGSGVAGAIIDEEGLPHVVAFIFIDHMNPSVR
jgi:O-acetyl-ADP-ribose deacetylase